MSFLASKLLSVVVVVVRMVLVLLLVVVLKGGSGEGERDEGAMGIATSIIQARW